MGPFSDLFKGVGSLIGATGDVVGGAASGAAKGVKGLGDVVSGEAFKPKLKRVPQPMADGVMKLVEHGKKEEERKRMRKEKDRKMQALAALNRRFN
jgi:hypothetical protein